MQKSSESKEHYRRINPLNWRLFELSVFRLISIAALVIALLFAINQHSVSFFHNANSSTPISASQFIRDWAFVIAYFFFCFYIGKRVFKDNIRLMDISFAISFFALIIFFLALWFKSVLCLESCHRNLPDVISFMAYSGIFELFYVLAVWALALPWFCFIVFAEDSKYEILNFLRIIPTFSILIMGVVPLIGFLLEVLTKGGLGLGILPIVSIELVLAVVSLLGILLISPYLFLRIIFIFIAYFILIFLIINH